MRLINYRHRLRGGIARYIATLSYDCRWTLLKRRRGGLPF